MSASLALSTAVVAIIGMVLLALATAALSGQLRELRKKIVGLQVGPTMIAPLSKFRWPSPTPGGSLVLFVREECNNCKDRIQDFAAIAADAPADVSLYLLMTSTPSRSYSLPRLGAVVDADIVGQLGLQAAPTLVSFDRNGAERWRLLAGGAESMRVQIEREWDHAAQ